MAEKAYKVLHIDQMVKPDDVKGIANYYRHTIKTKGGTVLNVNIEEKDFTPERAAIILESAAKNADAVLGL